MDVQSADASLLSAEKVKNFSITVTPANFKTAAYGSIIGVTATVPISNNSLFGSIFYKNMNADGSMDFMKEY